MRRVLTLSRECLAFGRWLSGMSKIDMERQSGLVKVHIEVKR